jgi:hypothetical protein
MRKSARGHGVCKPANIAGETVPPTSSLYEQIASVNGGIAPAIAQPAGPESVIEGEDEKDEDSWASWAIDVSGAAATRH